MVQKCVEQLLYEDEASYPPDWRTVKVWKPIRLKPGEAERRIRGHVREWLREARDAIGPGGWHATKNIHEIGRDVDAWFGAATDPVQKTTSAGVAAASAPREEALRRKVADLEQQNRDLVDADTAKNEEIATLRLTMQ